MCFPSTSEGRRRERGQKIAAVAEAAGLVCTVGSNLEMGVASAAMIHLAMATPAIAAEEFPCDILGPFFYEDDMLAEPLPIQAGKASPFERPGLGVELDERKWRSIGYARWHRRPDADGFSPAFGSAASSNRLLIVLLPKATLTRRLREKYQSKQYQEALPLAEKALREDSENPAKLDLYGSILAAMDQSYLAEENLRKAVSLAPDQAAFEYDLGALLHQERKYAEAVPVLKRAIALDPGQSYGAHDAGAILRVQLSRAADPKFRRTDAGTIELHREEKSSVSEGSSPHGLGLHQQWRT